METNRVSNWLKLKYPLLTQRQREECLTSRLVVYSDGRTAKKGDKVSLLSELNFTGLNKHLEVLKQGSHLDGVKVLHEADGIVVIDKPSGIAGHPLRLFDTGTITAWMRKKYPEINQLFLEPQPTLTPHRLDTGTSGVLIVALSPVSFKSWRERFKNKEITKTYLAWCWGAPENDEYVVDYSIAHAIGDSQRMVVVKGESGHRPPVLDALSYVKVVKRLPEHSLFLAQVVCRTGVTHQVRVHLASLGFPLLGDKLYDTDYTRRTLTRDYHALRAVRLDFHDGNFSVSDQEFRHEF